MTPATVTMATIGNHVPKVPIAVIPALVAFSATLFAPAMLVTCVFTCESTRATKAMTIAVTPSATTASLSPPSCPFRLFLIFMESTPLSFG